MGNPVFKFTLSHDIEGSIQISEMDGWKNAKLKLERHPDYHSLVEYFEGDFVFYGNNGVVNGGLEWIKDIEGLYGVDAEINILIEISFDDGDTYETIFQGLLDLSGIQELKNNKASIPIIRNDFWANFINRKETEVNLRSTTDLDGDSVTVPQSVELDLTSQKIQKKHTSVLQDSFSIFQADWSSSDYLQISMDLIQLDELKDFFNIPIATNSQIPVWIFAPTENGVYQFDLRIESSIIHFTYGELVPPNEPFCDNGRVIAGTQTKILWYIQKNNDTPLAFSKTDYTDSGDTSTVYSYLNSLSMVVGDVIRIYGDMASSLTEGDICTFCIYSENNRLTVQELLTAIPGCTPIGGTEYETIIDIGLSPSLAESPTYFKVTGQTFYQDTQSDTFLLHDAGAAITDRIIGQNNTFYSEFLGSSQTNARQYSSDGCGWKFTLAQGLQLRGYTLSQKQFAMSFNKWWNGSNPILNLGLGYEEVSGVEVIRVEEKEHFYNPSTLVTIDNVYEITREYDNDNIFKKIEIGYAKWQSEDVSGIDDPQTKHSYATRLQKVGTNIALYSEFIAASLAIEVTRRQTIEKSKDYKFDNDIFIIAINGDDVSPDRYRPALNERFNVINDLLNSDTRYNSNITPAWNFVRWRNFFNGGFQKYLTSNYRFIYGEGNYDMSSKMVVSTPGCDDDYSGALLDEGGDIPVTTDFLFLPQAFKIEIDLSWDDYKIIRENRKNAIGISQTTTGHKAFFIKLLEYELVNSKCTMTLWPAEEFNIGVVDFEQPVRTCEVDNDCPDALTDSFGVVLVNDSGECITA